MKCSTTVLVLVAVACGCSLSAAEEEFRVLYGPAKVLADDQVVSVGGGDYDGTAVISLNGVPLIVTSAGGGYVPIGRWLRNGENTIAVRGDYRVNLTARVLVVDPQVLKEDGKVNRILCELTCEPGSANCKGFTCTGALGDVDADRVADDKEFRAGALALLARYEKAISSNDYEAIADMMGYDIKVSRKMIARKDGSMSETDAKRVEKKITRWKAHDLDLLESEKWRIECDERGAVGYKGIDVEAYSFKLKRPPACVAPLVVVKVGGQYCMMSR